MQIHAYPSKTAEQKVAEIAKRGLAYKKKDLQAVNRILEDVRKNGDTALIKYAKQFDAPGMRAKDLRVTRQEIKEAPGKVAPAFKRALKMAARQIESFHRQQVPKSWIDKSRPGTVLGQLVNPVDAAGVYVPGGQGGQTPLVSSVLMGGIPAKIAGVKQVAMVTPPTADGTVNPHLLVAAQTAGIDNIFKVGSAWAIAALAYGTATIPKTDVIVGPGNIYVTLAKKIVAGTVGIDMIAGPSEVLIVADATANPDYLAADLLAQAEHDPLASAILVTNATDLAQAVSQAVQQQLATLPRRDIAQQSLARFGALFVVPDLNSAFELANRFAPEHLELQIADPFAHIGLIRNAGAAFIGPYTPEPVGDYIAGPNHVLPTAGTARFASALSVDHFIKKTSLVYYSKAAFKKEAANIVRLAEIEALDAHANSIKVRL